MDYAEFAIRALMDSAPANVTLSAEFKQWLWDNVSRRAVRVCVEDCICNELDFLAKYNEEEKFFYQDGKENKDFSKLDITKQALVFLGDGLDVIEPYNVVFWYIPENTEDEGKTKSIYAIVTTDDEEGNKSAKAYCDTFDIALREAETYYDYCSAVRAGAKNIVKLDLIIT